MRMIARRPLGGHAGGLRLCRGLGTDACSQDQAQRRLVTGSHSLCYDDYEGVDDTREYVT